MRRRRTSHRARSCTTVSASTCRTGTSAPRRRGQTPRARARAATEKLPIAYGNSSLPYSVCPYPASATCSGRSQDASMRETFARCSSKAPATCGTSAAPASANARRSASTRDTCGEEASQSSWCSRASSSSPAVPQLAPSLSAPRGRLHAHGTPNKNHRTRASAPSATRPQPGLRSSNMRRGEWNFSDCVDAFHAERFVVPLDFFGFFHRVTV